MKKLILVIVILFILFEFFGKDKVQNTINSGLDTAYSGYETGKKVVQDYQSRK